jgi:hypothetical protein
MMDAFHANLTPEQQADQAFAYRVVFVPKLGGKASNADLAVEFVKGDTEEAREINRVLLKEVDKRRYTATEIVKLMHAEGYSGFGLSHHSKLWQELDAKDPSKGFGRVGDYKNTWVWYEKWVDYVRSYCKQHIDEYL